LRIKDISGQRFGKLVVIKFSHTGGKYYRSFWLCKCDCGNTSIVAQSSLKGGHTKSCGCLIKNNGVRKHKLCKSRIYQIYARMKNVCYNKHSKDYAKYGGRGIDICKEWLGENGFINFYNWSIKNGFNENLSSKECTIDRIDNNKGYFPDNCRWTTLKVQQNNTRRNHYISYNGTTQTVAQWAESLNMNYTTLHERLRKGWSVEKSLSQPKQLHRYKNDKK
jgi:hypothetical protein